MVLEIKDYILIGFLGFIFVLNSVLILYMLTRSRTISSVWRQSFYILVMLGGSAVLALDFIYCYDRSFMVQANGNYLSLSPIKYLAMYCSGLLYFQFISNQMMVCNKMESISFPCMKRCSPLRTYKFWVKFNAAWLVVFFALSMAELTLQLCVDYNYSFIPRLLMNAVLVYYSVCQIALSLQFLARVDSHVDKKLAKCSFALSFVNAFQLALNNVAYIVFKTCQMLIKIPNSKWFYFSLNIWFIIGNYLQSAFAFQIFQIIRRKLTQSQNTPSTVYL